MQRPYEQALSTVPPLYRLLLRRWLESGEAPAHPAALVYLLQGEWQDAILTDYAGNLREVLKFLNSHVPRDIWGSPTRLKTWAAIGGFRGLDQPHHERGDDEWLGKGEGEGAAQ